MDAIDTVLELMDIRHLHEVKVGTLSTGERQRLLFAKTFLHEPQLWLLDEPLTPLDPGGQIEMAELLGELQAMGKKLSSLPPIVLRMSVGCVVLTRTSKTASAF